MRPIVLLLVLAGTAGCGKGFAIMERPKGEIGLRQPEALLVPLSVTPPTLSVSKIGVDVTVRYASPTELDRFFSDEKIFGKQAGKSPYPPETLIFYVKVANRSQKKIKVNPDDFVLIDNLNIQYAELSPDNISTLYEAKASVWSFAKTTGDLAPGPYGVPLKVVAAAGGGGGGGRKIHYLIKQVRLAAGYVHPGIAYDGYVAFPRPHPNTTSVRVLIANIKTDFNPDDTPATAIDFEFPLTVKPVEGPSPNSPEGGVGP